MRQTPYGIYCAQLGGGQVNTATGDFVFGMTEAYLIENGEITEPLRAANLIGNGPETLRLVDARRQRLRDVGRDLREDRPGRPGVGGSADAAGIGADGRRHRRWLSPTATCWRWRGASRAPRAPARRSRRTRSGRRETDVQVFGGEVESLSVAAIEGLGVRVVHDGRQGFAWAGSLDPDVVDETIGEAHDNASFGQPDEWNALVQPARVRPAHRGRARPVATEPARGRDRRQGRARARPRGRDPGRRPRCPRRHLRRLLRQRARVGGRQLARRRVPDPSHHEQLLVERGRG